MCEIEQYQERVRFNARLVAAAPYLFAAAWVAADALRNADPGNPKDETGWANDESLAAWLLLRAALARTRGAQS